MENQAGVVTHAQTLLLRPRQCVHSMRWATKQKQEVLPEKSAAAACVERTFTAEIKWGCFIVRTTQALAQPISFSRPLPGHCHSLLVEV